MYSKTGNNDVYYVINIDNKQVKIEFFDFMIVKKKSLYQNKCAIGFIKNSVTYSRDYGLLKIICLNKKTDQWQLKTESYVQLIL